MIPSTPRPRWFRLPLALTAIAFSASIAHAQCPDGTPPPCRRATVAQAPRPNPQLNPHEWVVVPFSNATRAQDLDWLSDASVNLLTMDLARWTDVAVVDDKRVGDLLRDLPARKGNEALTLNDGLAIARRSGAGMLVMGDFYRLGKGARIVANVFDVKSGARVRTTTQQAADGDSLLTAFAPLARGVLAVPPPVDAKVGAIGTSRTDAYQAYLLGVRALHRFDIPEAETQLNRAVAIDSTFALAHFKLSLAYGWGDIVKDSVPRRAHALAAVRLSASLPPRERALIAARAAEENNDYTRACELMEPIVRRDSSDVEALYEIGECSFHNAAIQVSTSDTATGRFVGSWNTSLRAMQRVLELDPAFHLAFNHILDILGSVVREGCVPTGKTCRKYDALVLRNGDSLQTLPVAYTLDSAAFKTQEVRSRGEHSTTVNLREAQRIAQAWVDADPGEDRAHYYLAKTLVAESDVEAADIQARLVRSGKDPMLRIDRLTQRIETTIKLGRAAEARALADSLAGEIGNDPDGGFTLAPIFGAFGQTARYKAYTAYQANLNKNPGGIPYFNHIPRALLGVDDDSLNIIERTYAGQPMSTGPCTGNCPRLRIRQTLMYAARANRTWWPSFPARLVDDFFRPTRSLAAGDTAALRGDARALDSTARVDFLAGYTEQGRAVVAADAYLALHDTASALKVTRFFVDTLMKPMALLSSSGLYIPASAMLWVRMMVLRADLAAAVGKKDEAVYWYRRVDDLWANAEPEIQPARARIRAAISALSRSGSP